MEPETITLLEEMGVVRGGEWRTEEDLLAEFKKTYPSWESAVWPLGAIDVGHMDAADRLMTPELGGTPEDYPNGPPRVLAFGEVLLDCLANEPSVKLGDPDSSWTAFAGGAPANVACALAKLGTSSGFIGCVGDDADGQKLKQVLSDEGIPTKTLQTVKGKKTRRVFVTRTEDGDREFAGFPDDTSNFADCSFDMAQIDGTMLYAADFLVTGTLGLAYPETREALTQLKQFCMEIGLVRFVDVNWRPVFWKQPEAKAKEIILEYLQGASLIKMTDEEAMWLFDMDQDQVLDKPATILKRLEGCVGVLVTAGEEGCAYAFGKHGGRLEAFDVPVVDSTGAGDAFSAGFLHKTMQLTDAWQIEKVTYEGVDNPLPRAHMPPVQRIAEAFKDKEMAGEAVVYAAAVAAMTCMEEGAIAAQPSKKIADKFMSVYGEDVVIEEEKRDFELPDMNADWLKWQFSR